MNEQSTADPQANGPQVVYVPAPPEKPTSWFRRHKILTALGIVAVVVVAAQLGGGGDDAPGSAAAQPSGAASQVASDDVSAEPEPAVEPEEPEETAEPEQEAAPGIGDPVRDGKFEFTVTEVELGVERVGEDYFVTEAQGQFVVVHLTTTNVGDSAQYFSGSDQDLIDTEGRTHSADSTAAIYLDGANSILEEINPGNTLGSILVFDLPQDAVPASIELHDSMFSGGVTVLLG